MKKALFIVGPTAVGKTGLAVRIANLYPPIKLISADSIQVYRNCDIISGKDHPKNVKIELIDIASPTDPFSVHDFQVKVRSILQESYKNKKIPLIVGGTGFYADSLFTRIDTLNIPPNKKLRARLEEKSLKYLKEELKKINPEKFAIMNESDVNNPRRLVRAIEVSQYSSLEDKYNPVFSKEDILFIGLRTDMKRLCEIIEERVEDRLKNGALREAKKLHENYSEIVPHIKNANGYKQLFQFLEGKISLEEGVKQWVISDYHHAKKQMTWFAKNPDIAWFDIEKNDYEENILRLIEQNFTSI